MTYSKRERVLTVVAGVLLLLIGGKFVLWIAGGPFGERLRERDKLATLVKNKQKAADELDQWKRRSLPADLASAKLHYEDWLRKLADRRLHDLNVDWSATRNHQDIYRELPVIVSGRGTMDDLTRFLYEFYSAGHLHKIGRLMIKPIKGSQDLGVVISIQALSLPGADRQDALSAEPSDRLALSKLEDYRKVVVRRRMEADRFVDSGGLFAAYVPLRPNVVRTEPRPGPEPPGFDPSRHAFVTAIVEEDGQPQVWLDVRTTGERFELYEGDPFEVGPLSGTVKRIEPRCVTIETGGESRRIKLGGNLHQAAEEPNMEERSTEEPDAEKSGPEGPGANVPDNGEKPTPEI